MTKARIISPVCFTRKEMACPPVLKMKLTIEPMKLGKRNAVFYQSVGDLSPCFCPVISGNLLPPLWQCRSSPWWQAQRRWGWSHAFTSAEREVKDSRRSGMYQSWNFWDKIGHARSVGFWFYSAIWRSESRISSRYLEITSISLLYSLTFSRKKELLFWLSRGLNRLTCVTRQIRGDSKLRA